MGKAGQVYDFLSVTRQIELTEVTDVAFVQRSEGRHETYLQIQIIQCQIIFARGFSKSKKICTADIKNR
jgi:hypothetical protein